MHNKKLIFYRIIMFNFLWLTQFTMKALTENEAYEIGLKAYLYAYPLVLMQETMKAQDHLNQFVHINKLPDYKFKDIVRPNVDTLYSFAWLDLSKGPIVLSLPDTHERYYLMELMDAWTNVVASLGKRTTGTKAQNFLIVGPGWKGKIPKGMTRIDVPTNIILILGRTQTNGIHDIPAVEKIQNGYNLTLLKLWQQHKTKHIKKFAVPYGIGKHKAPVNAVSDMDIVKFYSNFADALLKNPPSLDDKLMLAQLQKLDIIPGKKLKMQQWTRHEIAGLTRAMREIKTMFAQQLTIGELVNGWQIIHKNIGNYGTDYKTRAIVAYIGLGANLPEDALYPTAFVDGKGALLNGKNHYLLHFAKNELPPVNAFWSVTLYDSDSFLVKNKLQRYGLGDRDNLKFNADGSLDIYIQHESPGKNKESNWLPAPLGNFNLTMRLYWPKESALQGIWFPPAVKQI